MLQQAKQETVVFLEDKKLQEKRKKTIMKKKSKKLVKKNVKKTISATELVAKNSTVIGSHGRFIGTIRTDAEKAKRKIYSIPFPKQASMDSRAYVESFIERYERLTGKYTRDDIAFGYLPDFLADNGFESGNKIQVTILARKNPRAKADLQFLPLSNPLKVDCFICGMIATKWRSENPVDYNDQINTVLLLTEDKKTIIEMHRASKNLFISKVY